MKLTVDIPDDVVHRFREAEDAFTALIMSDEPRVDLRSLAVAGTVLSSVYREMAMSVGSQGGPVFRAMLTAADRHSVNAERKVKLSESHDRSRVDAARKRGLLPRTMDVEVGDRAAAALVGAPR